MSNDPHFTWTQTTELSHIRSLGTWSKRAEDLKTITDESKRTRERLIWKIQCLTGYLFGSVKPRDRSTRFPGYDHTELVMYTKRELAYAREKLGRAT